MALAPFDCGLPLTYVTDVEIDPRTNVLYAATYGRGAWTASILPPIEGAPAR